MGNCQAAEAAEAATVLIEHPGGKIERVYWSLSASEVMASNPGHYVAAIITSHLASPNLAGAGASVKHLKLLRPNDTLHISHVYRLVSFEEVLKEFAAKKHVRLSRFVRAAKEKRRSRLKRGGDGDLEADAGETSMPSTDVVTATDKRAGEAPAPFSRARQWRPALQSIEEVVGT